MSAFVSALFIVLFLLLFGKLQTPVISLTKPVFAIREEVSERLRDTSQRLLSSKEDLVEENVQLSLKIEKLENQLALLPHMEEELTFYKQIYQKQDSSEKIVGRVLSRPPFSPHDHLLIDVGSKNGVKRGVWVESASGTLLGKTTLVKEDFSFVMLFSSPDKKISAYLPGGDEVELVGMGAGNFYLELPKDAPLKKNDVLLESTTQKPLAIVSTVISSESNPFKQIHLKSMSSLNKLDRVLVDK